MAANIYVPTPADWGVIQEMLSVLEEGGIIVPPDKAVEYQSRHGDWEDKLDIPIDYDYGGEADLFVDVARDGNMADTAIREQLGETCTTY